MRVCSRARHLTIRYMSDHSLSLSLSLMVDSHIKLVSCLKDNAGERGIMVLYNETDEMPGGWGGGHFAGFAYVRHGECRSCEEILSDIYAELTRHQNRNPDLDMKVVRLNPRKAETRVELFLRPALETSFVSRAVRWLTGQ